MSYPHEFNLRGPWQYQVLSATRGLPQEGKTPARSGRITLPDTWAATLCPSFLGRVRFTRSFARPTNVDPSERLWLVVEGLDPGGMIWLDGDELTSLWGYGVATAHDVTDRLKPRSELAVEIELTEDPAIERLRPGREGRPGGLIGNVRLEVRRTLYLESLAMAAYAEPNGGEAAEILEISGGVMGTAGDEEDLAILVTAARQEVLLEAVVPHERFHFTIPVLGLPAWRAGEPALSDAGAGEVEVALVSGGVALWQTTRKVACRLLDSRDPVVEGIPTVEFPDAPPTVDGLRAALGTPLPGRIRSERILPDEYYSAFDDCRLEVIQQVPAGWAGQVCRRLAHHASIAAWQTLPGEDAGLLATLSFGRPWIAG